MNETKETCTYREFIDKLGDVIRQELDDDGSPLTVTIGDTDTTVRVLFGKYQFIGKGWMVAVTSKYIPDVLRTFVVPYIRLTE